MTLPLTRVGVARGVGASGCGRPRNEMTLTLTRAGAAPGVDVSGCGRRRNEMTLALTFAARCREWTAAGAGGGGTSGARTGPGGVQLGGRQRPRVAEMTMTQEWPRLAPSAAAVERAVRDQLTR